MSEMSYADAERRSKLGQKQYQCTCHGLWFWWNERKGHKFKAAKPEKDERE